MSFVKVKTNSHRGCVVILAGEGGGVVLNLDQARTIGEVMRWA